MSGSWNPARMNKKKPLREVAGAPLPNAPTRRSGRELLHMTSPIRNGAWRTSRGGIEETHMLSIPGSADEEHAHLSLAGAKARSTKGTVKRPVPDRVEAALPHRRPALFEARIPLGPGARSGYIRFFGKPICTVPSKTDAPSPQALDPVNVLAKLASVFDRCRRTRWYVGEGGAMTSVEPRRLSRTRHKCPGIVNVTLGIRMQEDLMTLPGEYWRPQQPPIYHSGCPGALRSVIVPVGRLHEPVLSRICTSPETEKRPRQ